MPRRKLKVTDEDRRLVKQLAAVGVPQEVIARKIGVRSPKTLRKHFREELDFGAVEANANVVGAVYKSAMEGNVAAQKLWLFHRSWKERPSGPAAPAQPPAFIVACKDAPNAEDPSEDLPTIPDEEAA